MPTDVAPGIFQDSADDADILIYRLAGVKSLEALSTWNDHIISKLDALPDDQNQLLMLYDLSSKGSSVPFLLLNEYRIFNVGVTPAGQRHVANVLQKRPNLEVYLAIVINDTLSGQIVTKHGRDTKIQNIHYQIFLNADEAVEWLEENKV